jgi:predicted metalloprotease with PDZ domain
MQNLRDSLAEVSGDRAFADEFFDRYIQGREVVDYETLLGRAGMLLRKRYPRRAWIGPVRLSIDRGGARIASPTIEDTPAHVAGLDQDDEIVSLDGEAIGTPAGLDDILQRHAPGDRLQVRIRRRGATETLTLTTTEDPRLELVPTDTNRPLTQSERKLRDEWLASRIR